MGVAVGVEMGIGPGLETVGVVEAEVVMAEVVEVRCFGNTKEGEEEKGGKRPPVVE